MVTVNIRNLIKDYKKYDAIDDIVKVKFDDGDLLVTSDEAFVGAIILKPITTYPNTKMLKKFFFTKYYKGDVFSDSTIKQTVNAILKYLVIDFFNKKVSHEIMFPFYRNVMLMEQELYRLAGMNGLKYWDSIDFEDGLEIQESKEVLDIINTVAKIQTPTAIRESYKKLREILLTDDRFRFNPIVIAYKAGILDDRQMDQSFASRGNTTEMDDYIFFHPVVSSYFLGLRDLYSWIIESRTAAKSLRLSLTVIQSSEYSSRKQQLAMMTVKRMVHGDCGSKEYEEWVLQTEDEVKNFSGKYYLGPDSTELELMKGDEFHLIGKKIRVRSARLCQLEDKTSICQKCLGDNFLLFPTHLNLGHISSTTNSKDVSQTSLSAKHLTVTAESREIKLDKTAIPYFTVKRDGIVLSKTANIKQIIIPYHQAQGLIDVFRDKRVERVSLPRMSHISNIFLITETEDGDVVIDVNIKSENRNAYISDVFLRHIINDNLTISNKNDFIIDMKGLKSVRPIFEYKKVEYSMEDQVKSNNRILEGTKTIGMDPKKFNLELFTIFNLKLNVNVVFTEIITYALTAKDLVNGNADLARFSKDPRVMSIPLAIRSRSAGGFLGFDKVINNISNPVAYKRTDKPSIPLDVIFKPNEVVNGVKELADRRNRWMKEKGYE